MKLFPRWTAIICLSMCYALAGCQGGNDGFKTAEQINKERPAGTGKDEHDHDHDHDHGHHHHAPHHGSLTMLGDHVAQIELVVDAEAGKLEAYVLDGEAEKALTVDQAELDLSVTLPEVKEPLALKLAAVDAAKPDDGFAVQNDQLKGVKALTGTLASLKIGEKTHEKIAVEYDAAKAAKEADEAHEHGHEHGDKKADDHDHDHKDKDKDHEAEHKDEKAADKPEEKPAEKPADKPAE